MSYNREAAVRYAHKWAFGRNPRYYDYEDIGGDCTNFVSQCLFAGGAAMDYRPDLGWYYINANDKAPAWTGVRYLFNFLTRAENTPGPRADCCEMSGLRPGDAVQLSVTGGDYHHTAIVVSAAFPLRPENILVAAHSFDADYRPVSTYYYEKIRFLHIR